MLSILVEEKQRETWKTKKELLGRNNDIYLVKAIKNWFITPKFYVSLKEILWDEIDDACFIDNQ